ncbi:MAG: PQQ-like beta-propeller repeat protein [bacterium]|nr:PQQ-like beta-propeller repeat protein [bacterium]
MNHLITRSVVVACLLAATMAHANEAPQFRGPNRDGIFPGTGLLEAWPDGGPTLLWKVTDIGMGYSSATVVGDTIYIAGMVGENEGMLFALGLDGSRKWELSYGEETRDKQAPGARSTLTVDGDRGYLISGLGVVTCFDLPKRAVLWQVDTLERFQGKQIQWTIAESPLIDGENLVCTPGGPDASLAALNKMTGETVWTSKGLSDASAYCSPNLIAHGDRRIIVTMTAKYVVGVDAATGDLLWTHEHPTDYGIHASTPVYADGMIYYSAGSKSGGGMLRLSDDGAQVTSEWKDLNLDNFHGGFVHRNGYIFGTTHRTTKEMMCLELATGKLVWRTEDVTEGAMVYADGMLYVYEGPKAGIVSLIKATPDGFERTGTFTITEGTAKHWAHPTIAGGRLYIRRGELLFAYAIDADS